MPDLMPTVKCVDCAFLALRHAKSLEITEADFDYRKHGNIPGENGRYLFHEAPVCTEGVKEFALPQWDRKAIFTYATAPIRCEKFVTWQPGISPAQTRELKLLEEVNKRARAWRDEDIALQLQIEALYETRHQELRADQRVQNSRSNAINLAAAIVSAIALIISIAALLANSN